jgi:hypothetical protein
MSERGEPMLGAARAARRATTDEARPTPHEPDARGSRGEPAGIQLKAGHSQDSITGRYIHAAHVLFPGAAARGEERMFGSAVRRLDDESPWCAGAFLLPGLDSNQQPSG